ncbi:MAG: hypothetical protein NVSMB1_17480 [Polyangiales bacterium]
MASPEPPNHFGEEYFAKTYGGSAGSYSERTTPNKWQSMCRFIKTNVPNRPATACDVGCAEGSFLAHALGYFPQTKWSGTDVSEYAMERARKNAPSVDFRQCSASELAFDDQVFDVVTAFDVLEHLPEVAAASKQIHRVLRPGGYLVASVPVYDGPLGWLVHALDKDPTHLQKRPRRWWTDRTSPLNDCFELVTWDGAWRYYMGRYWHLRGKVGRSASPAIVMAWKRR